ncbi:3-dehydroquinate synthase [Lactococcus termiticola]|nr:3-dehydroquinate synthase [Lactococcus termiticola]
MKIHVNMPQKPYDILIKRGGLEKASAWVSSLWQAQKILVISDDRVAGFYADRLLTDLNTAGFKASLFSFPAGEASKTLATAEKIWHHCAELGLTRSDGIIALGGGVVGDLAGFVASTYLRGIHFLQIATSLTAQVDSSVGGKTAVNTAIAKNMIGTFAQPDGVLIDPDLLKSLDSRCLIEGMGEVIKCGLIADKELWDFIQTMSGPETILENAEYLISRAVEVKRKLVVEDELDHGSRLYLNFGHTIGHAVETTAGYGHIMHGEAVAIGMVQISQHAEKQGLMPAGFTEKIKATCEKFGLPTSFEPWNEEELYAALSHDKKTRGDSIKTVIVPEIGQAKIHELKIQEMKSFLKKEGE